MEAAQALDSNRIITKITTTTLTMDTVMIRIRIRKARLKSNT